MNKPKLFRRICLVSTGLLFLMQLGAQEPVVLGDSAVKARVSQRADSLLNGPWLIEASGYQKPDSTTIVKVEISRKPKRIRVYADGQLAYMPFREATVDSIEKGLEASLGVDYEDYIFQLYSDKKNIRTYIPNYFRTDRKKMDTNRTPGKLKRKTMPLVQNLSRGHQIGFNLYNINIALCHSH